MTKSDIKLVEHLAINEEVEGKFYHVHVEEGYMLTSYKEGDDIKEYQGFECLYMPLGDEFVDFHVITKEEHDELQKACDEAHEAERKAEEDKE